MTDQPALTPSATVGPYLSIGLNWPDGSDAVEPGVSGTLTIGGTLYDGAGQPVPDGLIETWQADPDGRFDHPDDPRGARRRPGWRGFGRCPTGPTGQYLIRTIKPAMLPAEHGQLQAPHLDVSVFARGMLNRVITRIYFPDEIEANAIDPVLVSIRASERSRLVAIAAGPGQLRFDVYLQGDRQTPFFRI